MNKRKLENVVEMYLDGQSVGEIAKHFGATREAVYLYLREIPNFKDISRKFAEDRKKLRLRQYSTSTNDILKLREDGLSMRTISKALGMSYTRVRKLLKGTSLDNSHKSKLKRNRRICQMYKAGLTQREIAEELKLGQSTISNIIRKWGTSQKT